MKFWLALVAVNFVFFLPYYLLNIREQPNPFFFLWDPGTNLRQKFKFPYERRSSDPFRFSLEYSVLLMIFLTFGLQTNWAIGILSSVFVLVFVEVLYTGVMLYMFRRYPVLRSDLSLSRAGLVIAGNKKYGIYLLILTTTVVLGFIGWHTSRWLLVHPAPPIWQLILAMVGLLTLGLYRAKDYGYYNFHNRAVRSSLYYSYRNIQFGRKYDFLLEKDEAYFERLNIYKNVQLQNKPNIVTLCIESYGDVVFTDVEIYEEVKSVYQEYEIKLRESGYHLASNLSAPPIYYGGSWLSFSSFMYGIKISDAGLYDLLFKNAKAFGKYQSLFHFLNTQGYTNVLLCPLGGGYENKVDWDSIRNNFQSQVFLDWYKMNYTGKRFKYLDLGYSPADQYSLNYAHDYISKHNDGPYSLFFCTLNSHVPWSSPEEIAEDWKSLNDSSLEYSVTGDQKINLKIKYTKAIKYQLETAYDYILKNDLDDTIVTLFGDHQPPFITREKMGLFTPVHVISKRKELLLPFYSNGFAEGLDLSRSTYRPIRHEGYYSLFMQGLNRSCGLLPDLDLPYKSTGISFSA